MEEYQFKDPIAQLTYEQQLILENVLSNKLLVNSTLGAGSKITNVQIFNSEINSLKSTSLISIQGWTFDGVFSATDFDTVAWSAGTITLACGASFSINAGSTGNMTARTYIYFDMSASQVELAITGAASTAVGANKILMAVAEDNADATSDATFQVFGGTGGALFTKDNIAANTITANEIAANTLTANEMNVATLSAISANCGAITSGTITSTTVRTSASGGRAEMNPDDTFKVYNTDGNLRLTMGNNELIFSPGGRIMYNGTIDHLFDFGAAYIEAGKNFIPGEDEAYTCGSADQKWSDVRTLNETVYNDITVDGDVVGNSHKPRTGSDVNFYGNCIPYSAGADFDLGTDADYWDVINYTSLSAHSLVDLGDEIELINGEKVSNIEAVKRIQASDEIDPKSNKPLLQKDSFPKAIYRPAPIAEKDIYEKEDDWTLEDDEQKRIRFRKGEKAGTDGTDVNNLISLLLGAIKELDQRLIILENR